VSAKRLEYARLERERRFLLDALPAEAARADWEQLDDLYFPGTTLRLRCVTGPDGAVRERKLNQKLPAPDGAPHARVITSVYLDDADFALLAHLPGGAPLAKRRHRLAGGGHVLGVDVFLGSLAGLVLAEVELDSEAALRAFAPPPFARREVTDDARFTGGRLATGDPAAVLKHARELLRAAESSR
jgi:CYTH domain-containing protein